MDSSAKSKKSTVCTLPHCIFTDWQTVELEDLPVESVQQFMTAEPVVVTSDRPITELARKMLDAGIHRLIVIDSENKPIGVVSNTDLLVALAASESAPTVETI